MHKTTNSAAKRKKNITAIFSQIIKKKPINANSNHKEILRFQQQQQLFFIISTRLVAWRRTLTYRKPANSEMKPLDIRQESKHSTKLERAGRNRTLATDNEDSRSSASINVGHAILKFVY